MNLFHRAALALAAFVLSAVAMPALADAPFQPLNGSTVSLSASTSSSSVTLVGLPSGGGGSKRQFRLHNAGSVLVFVVQGVCSGLTATTASLPIPAGAVEVLSFDASDTRACLAGITTSGTATLYVTTGEGI